MSELVLIDAKYNWKLRHSGAFTIYYAGRTQIDELLGALSGESPEISSITKLLYGLTGNFALIMESPNEVLAAVDKIRSYPVFYFSRDSAFCVSNSARQLKAHFPLDEVDALSLLEFRMAGYVTGHGTLIRNLYQLQAGEYILFQKETAQLDRHRYFLFYAEDVNQSSKEDLIDQLDELTNKVFQRTLEDAAGKPIWVPLSGGLDSRLVLCKLKQLGYDNLNAFSYGPPHNYEAKWAEVVSQRLGIPWRFIPYTTREVREFFFSPIRKEYWEFCQDYSSLPFMVDELAIHTLIRKGLIDNECVLVNGQSGDFITGGHSYGYHQEAKPDDGGLFGRHELVTAILKKHYSMDYRLMTEANERRLTTKILSLLEPLPADQFSVQQLVKFYEWWEWQERQSKFVVNGQRSYDFFGAKWALPLWADEYLFFWRSISYEHKNNESLYKAYLEKLDFFGLFRDFKPTVWNWQGPSLLVLPAAAVVRRVLGRGAAETLYHYLSYFGKYHNHYAPFGFLKWLRHAAYVKSPLVFYADVALKEYRLS